MRLLCLVLLHSCMKFMINHTFPSSFHFQTHTLYNENSAEAESHHNAEYHCQVEVDEDEEDQVEKVIPPVKDQTKRQTEDWQRMKNISSSTKTSSSRVRVFFLIVGIEEK